MALDSGCIAALDVPRQKRLDCAPDMARHAAGGTNEIAFQQGANDRCFLLQASPVHDDTALEQFINSNKKRLLLDFESIIILHDVVY